MSEYNKLNELSVQVAKLRGDMHYALKVLNDVAQRVADLEHPVSNVKAYDRVSPELMRG